MKTVCVIVQNYYEIDIRVRRKTEALLSAGYDVDVLALRSSFSKSKNYRLDGVNVYTFSLGKKRGSVSRYYFEYLAFFFWALFKVSRLTKQRSYLVIDVNNLPDFLVFTGLYARWKGAKILFDMHEITPEFLMSKYQVSERYWQVKLARFFERISFSFADHVITINEPIQRLLESRGLQRSKSTIIMNSVDETLFRKDPDAAGLRRVGQKPDQFVMMYHGTMTRIYGLDIALQAFGLIHEEMPGAELWLVGGGPERPKLASAAATLGIGPKVRFIPMVLPEEIPNWLKQCDVGILPTRSDVFLDLSFSNKLSEYIIVGKPVIASRLKSIRHYFSEEAIAFFEPNTPDDLARQMLRLYQNSDNLRTRLKERANQEYRPIAWDVMKRRFLDLMDVLVTVPPGRSKGTGI